MAVSLREKLGFKREDQYAPAPLNSPSVSKTAESHQTDVIPQRHRQDVEDKYRAVVEVELDRLVWYRVPGVRAVLGVERRDQKHHLDAYYNLYTNQLEAPLCEVCHRAEGLTLGPSGHPACPDHAPI